MTDSTEPYPGGEADEALDSADVEEIQAGPFEQTAPVFPWELILNSASWFFQKIPGGVVLKFAPLLATPQGQQIMPPGFAIQFNDDGWERFKRDVERDGEVSKVAVASHIPAAGPRMAGSLRTRGR